MGGNWGWWYIFEDWSREGARKAIWEIGMTDTKAQRWKAARTHFWDSLSSKGPVAQVEAATIKGDRWHCSDHSLPPGQHEQQPGNGQPG